MYLLACSAPTPLRLPLCARIDAVRLLLSRDWLRLDGLLGVALAAAAVDSLSVESAEGG